MSEEQIFPAITLYQPWATWIMRGWKPVETRTHDKFKSLIHKTILIHAGLTTDSAAINNPYLTKEQLLFKPDEMINGFILGSAYVEDFDILTAEESKGALIDCGTVKRYGLFLSNIKKFETPIPIKGEMGIWYFDMITKQKIKKEKIKQQLQIFP